MILESLDLISGPYVYVCRDRQDHFSIPHDCVDDLGGAEAESPAARPFLALLPINFSLAVNGRYGFTTCLNSRKTSREPSYRHFIYSFGDVAPLLGIIRFAHPRVYVAYLRSGHVNARPYGNCVRNGRCCGRRLITTAFI